MSDRVTYRAVATYAKPETEKEAALRLARKLPQKMFSFIVERTENEPTSNPRKIRAHSEGA